MVNVEYELAVQKKIHKRKDQGLKDRIKKQIEKIILNPEIGKPMKYSRKNTREVYISPFRLSYAYEVNKIIFLELYHKDEQ